MSDENYWNSKANEYDMQAQNNWNNGDNWEYHQAQNQAAEARRYAEEARRAQVSSNYFTPTATTNSSSANTYSGANNGCESFPGGDGKEGFLGFFVGGIFKIIFDVFLYVGLPLLILAEIVGQWAYTYNTETHKIYDRNSKLIAEIRKNPADFTFRSKEWKPSGFYANEKLTKSMNNMNNFTLIQVIKNKESRKTEEYEKSDSAFYLLTSRLKMDPGSFSEKDLRSLKETYFGSAIFWKPFKAEDVSVAADYIVLAKMGMVNPEYPLFKKYTYDHNSPHIDHAYAILKKNGSSYGEELGYLEEIYKKSGLNTPSVSSVTGAYSISSGLCILGYCADPKLIGFHVIPGLLEVFGIKS